MTEPFDWTRASACSAGGQCVEVAFRKASACTGTATCIEVGFHKATASSQGMNCVEVDCHCEEDFVLVRDSKDPDGPRLRFSWAEFEAFKAGVRAGEFESEVRS